MNTYRVMIEFKIQSSIVYILASDKAQAVTKALNLAPLAQRAYVL